MFYWANVEFFVSSESEPPGDETEAEAENGRGSMRIICAMRNEVEIGSEVRFVRFFNVDMYL